MSSQPVLHAHWIDVFTETFALCGVKAGEVCAVLSETRTRPELPKLSELALQRLKAQVFHVTLPARPLAVGVPVRSTGASDAIGGVKPVVEALAGCGFIADCTVEGLMHSAELPQILSRGARALYISHEHPEILERCRPLPEDEAPVREAMKRLRSAKRMTVSSPAGTDLTVNLEGARVGGVWGFSAKPGTLSHWPGGLVLAFPALGAVSGRLVLAPGDVNLTLKRYLQAAVTLHIESDHAVAVKGEGVDADLMRSQFAAWGDAEAYAVSHVGWGMNRRARWDAMAFYDQADFNGTELRAFGGNFLYSTGANEVAGRHTLGHFDLPLKGCTVMVDGVAVVDGGVLV